MARHGVVEQGNVDGRQYGEKQHFLYGQHVEAAVQAKVGNAELQGACQPEAAHQRGGQASPDAQRDENRCRYRDARQHGKITIDLGGQVLANQAERKCPENRDNNQVTHR